MGKAMGGGTAKSAVRMEEEMTEYVVTVMFVRPPDGKAPQVQTLRYNRKETALIVAEELNTYADVRARVDHDPPKLWSVAQLQGGDG